MGKISPVSAKYIVHVQIQIEGVVERPDVIGSVFGQTEGLLGADLELRELQRSGRIGRIEVELDTKGGKSTGNIIIPSSLDKTETVLIAAALETIERIGPCNARVRVENVEDIRISKRKAVIERAKELLGKLTRTVLPDSRDIRDEVADSIKLMEITEYGKDRLPAGPGIDESDEIIVVEGRADVLNLLKNEIKNCIALNGTSVPQTVIDLSKRKIVTVFVDGDRGGDLIIRELSMVAEIDYAVKAPDGKEVEEITKKEIHKALRSKVAVEQAKMEIKLENHRKELDHRDYRKELEKPREMPREMKEIAGKDYHREFQKNSLVRRENLDFRGRQVIQKPALKKFVLKKGEEERFREMLDDLIGTKGAYLLDDGANILGKVPMSELGSTIESLNTGIYAIVFDGSITKDIVSMAEKNDVKCIVGMDSNVNPEETRISVITNKNLLV